MELELTTPHHVTVGFTGVPGDRTFFLQAEDLEVRVTLLLEKGQVEGLGELLGQLLTRVGDEPATDWDHDAMALRDPIDPRFRVGQIGFGFDPDAERFVLELTEVSAEERTTTGRPAAGLAGPRPGPAAGRPRRRGRRAGAPAVRAVRTTDGARR
jgi:uncharacterized repeat protein (TIGR03847 family)